jgi:RNA polymerase sigma-70 factor (ECF subfamily)
MTGSEPFETFVRTHQDMVFATAVRLLGNASDAEDIAQHVFLKAFQQFGAQPGGDAAAWLKTVTRNACLNHLTRYRRRWRLFSELDAEDGDTDRDSYASRLSAAAVPSLLEIDDEHALLEEALRRLPDHQRVPLVLFHFEHASYQEIANTLRVSVGKVKTDIHRGREALKQLLVQTHGTRRT